MVQKDESVAFVVRVYGGLVVFEVSYIHVLDDLEPAWLFQFVALRPNCTPPGKAGTPGLF